MVPGALTHTSQTEARQDHTVSTAPAIKMANFDWLKKIGATDAAVAAVNDQPSLLINVLVVLIGLGLECLLVWYIHFATLKPEQRKKKVKKPAGDNAKGAAGRK